MQKMLVVLLFVAAAGQVFGAKPQVTIQVSGAVSGDIVVELEPDKAPITVANFISYIQSGFYDGLIFHRVIEGFMVQGGGFDTSLVQKTPGASIANESYNGLLNLRGTVAMARTSDPHSATSQFFVNHADNGFLDRGPVAYDGSGNAYILAGYCVFGRVISGMDVVDAIAVLPTGVEGGMSDVPINDVIIQNVTIYTTVCIEKLDGDLDGDCDVDLGDFVLLAQNWLSCNSIAGGCN